MKFGTLSVCFEIKYFDEGSEEEASRYSRLQSMIMNVVNGGVEQRGDNDVEKRQASFVKQEEVGVVRQRQRLQSVAFGARPH
jgi:hypothetical protein